MPPNRPTKCSLPLVRAVGVGRQQGIVVVRVEEGQQGEAVRRAGLLQLDQNDLPESLRGTTWDFAYRYGAVPYELAVSVDKVLPRISVTELVEADLSAEKLVLNWQGLYTIEEAGLFQLRVDLPDGFEVRTVEGKAIGDLRSGGRGFLPSRRGRRQHVAGESLQKGLWQGRPECPVGAAAERSEPAVADRNRFDAASAAAARDGRRRGVRPGLAGGQRPGEPAHQSGAGRRACGASRLPRHFRPSPPRRAGSKPLQPVLAYAFAKGAAQAVGHRRAAASASHGQSAGARRDRFGRREVQRLLVSTTSSTAA